MILEGSEQCKRVLELFDAKVRESDLQYITHGGAYRFLFKLGEDYVMKVFADDESEWENENE